MNGAVTAQGFSSAPQCPWLFCHSESYAGFGTQLVGLKKKKVSNTDITAFENKNYRNSCSNKTEDIMQIYLAYAASVWLT